MSTTVARQVSTSWASSGRGEKVDMRRGHGAGQRHTEDGGHGLGPVAHEHAHGVARRSTPAASSARPMRRASVSRRS